MVASHLIKPLIIMTQVGWGLVETSHLVPTLLLPCSQLLQLAEKLLPSSCLNISLDAILPIKVTLPEDRQGSGREEQRGPPPA